jgi:hypothetical protein
LIKNIVNRQESTTNKLETTTRTPLLPTLSTQIPRQGAIPAEIRKGRLYRAEAILVGILNSLLSIGGVFQAYGNIEQ